MPLTDNQKGHLRHVQLNVWEVKFLEYIGEREGRINFDFQKVTLPVQNAIWALSNKQLITIERHVQIMLGEYVSVIKLTDQGRAILSTLESMRVKTT